MNDLQRKWNFDTGNGWDQVRTSPIQRIIAYGRFIELRDLISD